MKLSELANMVTQAFFDYDPYNGADEEDVYSATLQELRSIEGCHEIIIELAEMLCNAVEA